MKKPSRIVQWDGRRHSSRSEQPVLHALWQRPALLRLAAVLLTVATATGLAYFWGPPLPYRIGEVCPTDLRARVSFEVVNLSQTARAREDAVDRLPPVARDDPAACEAARGPAPRVIDNYPRRPPLLPPGQPLPAHQFPAA